MAGAWDGVCPFPIRGRCGKPRQNGFTILIDKGMGLQETADLLEVGAPYIDFIKLAFGTSAFYDREFLRKKVELCQRYAVDPYPGGTFLEVAALQGKAIPFVERAAELGFHYVEVSDGTVPMSAEFRQDVIQAGLNHGLRVITEVGKKHPADRVPGSNIRQQIESDVENGAYRVIVEGRESGKGVVIYRSDGSVDEGELEMLIDRLPDPDLLIWEAPHKEQQQDLILRFGPNVNLGNIPPHEILSLEALRVGLRGDTLRAVILGNPDRLQPLRGKEDW